MCDKLLFKDSVRGIIEYALKSGSLDERFVSRGRAINGTIAHGKLQKDNENLYQDYQKEVKMKHEFCRDNITLLVEGRADGIIKEKENIIKDYFNTFGINNYIPYLQEAKESYLQKVLQLLQERLAQR